MEELQTKIDKLKETIKMEQMFYDTACESPIETKQYQKALAKQGQKLEDMKQELSDLEVELDHKKNFKYPHPHSKHEEISKIKARLDDKFDTYKELMATAREEYRKAHEALKQMGANQKTAQEVIEALAAEMKELEILITAPNI